MQLKDYIPFINQKQSKVFFSGLSFDSSKVRKNDIFFALSHGVGTGKLRKKNNKKENLDERVIFFRELKKLSPHVMFDLYGFDGI